MYINTAKSETLVLGKGGKKFRIQVYGQQRWIDVVRTDCADTGMTIYDAIRHTQDRDAWRRSVAELPLRAPRASPRH